MSKKVILFNPPLYFADGIPHALDVSVPPLGLLSLASYINLSDSQFKTEVVDIAAEKYPLGDIKRLVRSKKPSIIGLTSMTPQLQGTVELAGFLKREFGQKIQLFLGGPHVSADPDFVNRFDDLFNFAITGEAEKTFFESLQKLAAGKRIPKIQTGETITDLDEIPFPDRKLIRREKYSGWESMMFSRGCPYHCYYCSRPSISRLTRYRSAKNLLEEIEKVYDNCQGRIDFQDDTFTLNRERVISFCEGVISKGLKLNWRCNSRIDLVDKELLSLMRAAGCSLIHFGIEAGNEKVRQEIVNKGRFTNKQITKVISWCHENQIKFAGYFMIGHPGETREDIEETKEMILNSKVDLVGLSIPTPFPGSRLYDMAKEAGVIDEQLIDRFARKELGEGYVGNYPVYTSGKISREEIYSQMKEINRRFYLKPKVFWGKFLEDVTSPVRLKEDFRDFMSLVIKGMSSRKPYLKPAAALPLTGRKAKIVFVVVGVESLAVEFLSSFLKAFGYEVDLVFDPRLFASEAVRSPKLAEFFDIKKELAGEIVSKKPDIVGFSVFTFNYQRCLSLAREVKKLNRKIPIIFGGIHPTSVPRVVITENCVDMICVGEGEYALKELLDNLGKERKRYDIQNLWFKKNNKIIQNSCRPLISDLDKMPFPDKELFYRIYSKFVTDDYFTLSSRGCPFACTYCGNNVLRRMYRGLGPPVRRRSPKNICDELELVKEKYRPKQVTFADDVFVQDLKWLREFAREYKKRVGLPYVMITHPRFVNFQIAKLLAGSGCYLLMFGLQSASEKTRFDILKRYETNQEIEKAARDCHQAGLNFSIDHIFNIPTEGLKEYEEALVFYNKLRPTIINAYWLQYFPGTEIIQTAIKEGIIKKSMVKEINEGRTSTSLVVGIGGKDDFDPQLVYRNFQFLFMLLPVLPQKLVNKIIEKKLYLAPFHPLMIINVGVKFFVSLLNKREKVYLGIVKALGYFMIANSKLKVRYKFMR